MDRKQTALPPLPEGFTLDSVATNQLPPLPEGFTLDVAPTPVKQQLQDAFEKRKGEVQSKGYARAQGFSQRLGADIDKRAENIMRNVIDPKYTPLETGVNVAGNFAGAGYDVLGNAVGSAYRALPDVEYGLGEAGQAIAESPVGDAGRYVGGKIGQVTQAYPQTSEYMGSLLNIAGIAPTAQVTKTAVVKSGDLVGQGLQKVGGAVKQSGIAGELAKKKEFVKDLVMPVQTKKVLEDQASRTTEKGLLKTKVVEPTPLEAASIDEVANIKGIKKGNSAQANYTLIEKAKDAEAQRLGGVLKSKYDFQISKPLYQKKLGAVVNKLKTDDPFILGNESAEKLVDNLANKMQALLDKNPNTPAGLLKSRQEFDAWAKSNKRGVFEGNEGTFSNAVSSIRQSANDFLAESVPDAAVKESFRKQSLLFRALDNVEPKTAMEGRNRLQRLAKSTSDAIPVKNPITKGVLQTAGLAGLAGGAYMAPVAAAALGLGGLGYGAIKSLPAAAKALGSLTELTGTALRGGKRLTPKGAGGIAPALGNQPLMLPSPDKFKSTGFAGSIDERLANAQMLKEAQGNTPTIYQAGEVRKQLPSPERLRGGGYGAPSQEALGNAAMLREAQTQTPTIYQGGRVDPKLLPAPEGMQPIVSPSFPIDRATNFDEALQKSFEARKAAAIGGRVEPTVMAMSRTEPNYAQKLRRNLMAEDVAPLQSRGALMPKAQQANFEMPLIKKLKASGGVRVGSTLDKELRHMGINPKSMPGLFRKNGGLRDVDRFPADEMEGYGLKIGEEADNGYVNRNTILDAISDEYGFYKKSKDLGVDDVYLNDLGVAADRFNIKTDGKTIQRLESEVNEAIDYEAWLAENLDVNDSLEAAAAKAKRLEQQWLESRGDAWEPDTIQQITLDELEKYTK